MTAFDFADRDVFLTTANRVEGMDTTDYRGLVIADVTEGRHAGKDFLSGLRNFFGGRSQSWEKTLRESQEAALRELTNKAQELGANAIVGIRMEDEMVGAGGGMMNVKAIGTAVVVDQPGR